MVKIVPKQTNFDKKAIGVKIPADKHCPVCGKTQPNPHAHMVYKKDANRIDVEW